MVSKNMANYLHRKSTIFKRAQELSTLCDVDVLFILYGPDSPNIPQTWCSQPDSATVIDKYYTKMKPNNKVKPNKAIKKKVSRDDHQFLGKLCLDELNDLNSVLAGKIESVYQRINGIKEGNKTRDLIDFNDGLNVEDLGCQGNNLACSSSRFVGGIEEGNKGFSNLSKSMGFWFGFDGKTEFINYNDGLNVDDLGFEGINRAFVDDYCQGTDDLMIDISDMNYIKFVGEDLELINQLATVQDVASASEFLCY